jgi:hypothetical protein
MNKSLFELMPSKALVTLVSANNIKEKSFGNPEWHDAYRLFVKQTNYKDIDAEKFLSYVKFYSRLQKTTADRMEVAKDGAVTTTMTRMMDRGLMKKGIQDYREDMLGKYYGIR